MESTRLLLVLGFCLALVACEGKKPAFSAPQNYELQGTSVVSSGAVDERCGAAFDAAAGTGAFSMQAPRAIEFEISIAAQSDGGFTLGDSGGCVLALDVNDELDRLSATDRPCSLAEDASLRAWGVTERTYRHLVLDFAARRFSESSRSLAVDADGSASVQCAVAEGVILGQTK